MKDKKIKPITCYLHQELDSELLNWVKSKRNQSGTVKEALQLAMDVDKKKKVLIDINSTSAIRNLFSALPSENIALEPNNNDKEDEILNNEDEVVEDTIGQEEINDILSMINIKR